MGITAKIQQYCDIDFYLSPFGMSSCTITYPQGARYLYAIDYSKGKSWLDDYQHIKNITSHNIGQRQRLLGRLVNKIKLDQQTRLLKKLGDNVLYKNP